MPTPLKNMKVSWDDDIPKIWNNKKCYKPPNQYIYMHMAADISRYSWFEATEKD